MTGATTPSGATIRELAEAYFDQVIEPTLSILTTKDQGYVYECFIEHACGSAKAGDGLRVWAAQNPPSGN